MGESKSEYDSLNRKWKDRLRPRVTQFYADEASESEEVEVRETNATSGLFTSKMESSGEYLRLKEQEIELERRDQVKLERLKLAQAKEFKEKRLAPQVKEYELQLEMFQFKQQAKMEKEIVFYNGPPFNRETTREGFRVEAQI
ncbi:hypothetical protein Tco_0781330 [Tanacetum coccineum]